MSWTGSNKRRWHSGDGTEQATTRRTTISVAMGTYNGARFIKQQLESLLAQEMLPLELQIGDDGSSDQTLAIIECFAKEAPFPVNVVRNPQRLGYGENFLRTAARCRGAWIAFCDQDDVWRADKLRRCLEAIANGPADLMLVVHPATLGDVDLKRTGELSFPPPGCYPALSLSPEWVCQGFRQVVNSSLIKDFSFNHREMSWQAYPDAHDSWTCLLASISGSIISLTDALVTYRRHDSNVTPLNPPPGNGALTQSKLGSALAVEADYYRSIAEVMRLIARYVSAIKPMQVGKADMLTRAALTIERRGDGLELRAQAQDGQWLAIRLAGFAKALSSGHYAVPGTSRFLWRSALKDLVVMVLPLKR